VVEVLALKPLSAYAVDGALPRRVVSPASVDELARALRDTHTAGEAVVPWGGGTRIHVGGIPRRYDVAVDLAGLDRVLEHEPGDLTVTVQAGVRVATLQALLETHGQRLAYDPPFPEAATIGGSLASNAVGPLASAFGGVRDLVIGMKVVQADGTVTKSGGKVVKNVSGYDLMRPHIGAFGTLGVIAEASFKLTPLPHATRTYAAAFDSLERAKMACEAVLTAPFQPERFTLAVGPAVARAVAAGRSGLNGGAGRHWLVLTLAAGASAVGRMVSEASRIMREAGAAWHEVVDEAAAGRFWTAIEPDGGEAGFPALSLRTTLKPVAAFQYLQTIENETSTARASFRHDWVLQVGFGTVVSHLWTTPGRPDKGDSALLVRTIELARSAARDAGVTLTVERCPAETKRLVDVWGVSGPALDLMRSLKSQFDPAGTLGPGRFVGGI
jgi:glycolate oxidase FAD binding subunit